MKNLGFQFDTTYTNLDQHFFTKLKPHAPISPGIVIINHPLAASMGLNFSDLSVEEQAALFSGKFIPDGATPFAQAYAGHQFGHFTILGDGRAHILGEHLTPEKQRFDIQLKGSGRTPYSRNGDGKAALGPMLREYIISEAMHHLGVPTTRSLAVATTGESVLRDKRLPGAVLTRVASSHIRIGTFEFAASLNDKKIIGNLLDYTIQRHDPELISYPNRALAFLNSAMEKQIDLIIHWMRIGFIHGVMNTDNMAVSGETIDYGPCAFMDAFNPHTVFSSIDSMGRYAYMNQPIVAQWNFARLAETLLPLIDPNLNKAIRLAEEILHQFSERYDRKWLEMMSAKLGLFNPHHNDKQLIVDLLHWMKTNHADYSNTFFELSKSDKPTGPHFTQKTFQDWYFRWQTRLKQNTQPISASLQLMQMTNPAVIPRNHQVEQVLEAANIGDFTPVRDLLVALEEPYIDKMLLKPYQVPPRPDEQVYQTFCGT